MMKFEPIGADTLQTALSLLVEGFPERSEAFWRAGLQRATPAAARSGVPLGQILVSKGVPSGVILTLGSRRAARPEPVVNLSAWYVRETHRFLAPGMLKAVTSGAATYTDLTPTPQVVRLSGSIGFVPMSSATGVVPLAIAAFRPSRTIRVAPWRQLRLSADDALLSEDHEAFGCLVLGIATELGDSVVIFRRTQYFQLPGVEAIYGSLTVIRDGIGAIARALLGQGFATLIYDCGSKDGAAPFTVFRRSHNQRMIKGAGFAPKIDYAWSELPILNP